MEEINFGDCLLKSRGAIILAEALQDGHFALETLILEANEIGPNGGCAVASAVINKEQLQRLALNANQVSQFDIFVIYLNRVLINTDYVFNFSY